MCERGAIQPTPPADLVDRRTFARLAVGSIAAALALSGAAPAGATPATVDFDGAPVIPRSEWGAALPPKGPLHPETDVRILVVHHSVDPAAVYQSDAVPGILRQFYGFHTGAAKGWSDIAYNFLIDRFGRIWEGRTGSLAGPIAGDATGGSQGFDQKCCFIGDFSTSAPTPEALAGMGAILGALGRRHHIDLGPGATATFTSRGSNKKPPGTKVTTPTISGHRDLSSTACPGNAGYAALPDLRLIAAVAAPPSINVPVASTKPQAGQPAPASAPAAGQSTTTTAVERTAPVGDRGEPGGSGLHGAALLGSVGAGTGAVIAIVGATVVRSRRRATSEGATYDLDDGGAT